MFQRLIGIAFLIAAVWVAANTWAARNGYTRTTGTVVGTESLLELDAEGLALLRRPIITFRPAPNAAPVQFRPNAWSTWGGHATGDSIAIRHPPGRPADAELHNLLHDVLAPIVLFVLGIAGLRGRLRSDGGSVVVARWED